MLSWKWWVSVFLRKNLSTTIEKKYLQLCNIINFIFFLRLLPLDWNVYCFYMIFAITLVDRYYMTKILSFSRNTFHHLHFRNRELVERHWITGARSFMKLCIYKNKIPVKDFARENKSSFTDSTKFGRDI